MIPFPEGRIERVAEDVVVIHSSLGKDFVRVCPTHRWASGDSVFRRDLPTCPHCALADDRIGLDRFAQIQLRLMPQEAPHDYQHTRDRA